MRPRGSGRGWYRAGVLLALALLVTPVLASITDDIDPKVRVVFTGAQFVVNLVTTEGTALVTVVADGETLKFEGTYTVEGNEVTVEAPVPGLGGKDVEVVDVILN